MSLLKRIVKSQRPPEQTGGSTSRLRELQPRVRPTPAQDVHADIKARVQNQLIAELDEDVDTSKPDEVRAVIAELFDRILTEENILLGRTDRARLFESVVADILGLGPIQSFLDDESIHYGQLRLNELEKVCQ